MSEEKSKDVETDNRFIFMKGDFNEESAHEIVKKLFDLETKDPFSDITIFIDSYGGYVDSFIAMHDAIRLCRCDVATVCLGKAMSCGQMLLISGKKGKRFITPNSTVLMHPLSMGNYGNIHEIEIEAKEGRRQQDMLQNMIRKYTKINKKKLDELMSKDSYIPAKEALELGIVDHIVDSMGDISKHLKTTRTK